MERNEKVLLWGVFSAAIALVAQACGSSSTNYPNTSTPQCTPACPAGQTCVYDNGTKTTCKAASTSCVTDTQCPNGQTCQNGTCKSPGTTTCTTDAQCLNGQKCQNGTCQTNTGGCTSDQQCTNGNKCQNGQCVPATTGAKTCGEILACWLQTGCDANAAYQAGSAQAQSAFMAVYNCVTGCENATDVTQCIKDNCAAQVQACK